ncbi:MAG: hypothetical protein VB030_04455 [Eubacterium aggregans]|uniref:hypothetical protein n=1 Tax=Eubacterium aggregans TaxID=81409 RepID=UPI002B212DC2|nr:hypothetical protein [Eubacterium aggregans]MEA5073408.1 hypothetical protein [Eubacterium aggregans]
MSKTLSDNLNVTMSNNLDIDEPLFCLTLDDAYTVHESLYDAAQLAIHQIKHAPLTQSEREEFEESFDEYRSLYVRLSSFLSSEDPDFNPPSFPVLLGR